MASQIRAIFTINRVLRSSGRNVYQKVIRNRFRKTTPFLLKRPMDGPVKCYLGSKIQCKLSLSINIVRKIFQPCTLIIAHMFTCVSDLKTKYFIYSSVLNIWLEILDRFPRVQNSQHNRFPIVITTDLFARVSNWWLQSTFHKDVFHWNVPQLYHAMHRKYMEWFPELLLESRTPCTIKTIQRIAGMNGSVNWIYW